MTRLGRAWILASLLGTACATSITCNSAPFDISIDRSHGDDDDDWDHGHYYYVDDCCWDGGWVDWWW